MKNILLVFCIAYWSISCGSKKEFSRSDAVEHIQMNEQLYAELYRDSRMLELLDVKIRQVETRDLAGNIRKEMNVDISKKTDRQDLDTTKIKADRQQTGEKVMKTEVEKVRSGIVKYWVWIIGFVAVVVISLVVGIYVVKK